MDSKFQTTIEAKRKLSAAISEALQQFRPPPELTVSEWADTERQLSAESSSAPGQYRTEWTEYGREIMDAFCDPDVKEVVVMSSAQVGKTTWIENVLGYHIHHDAAPVMILFPTLDLAETFSKDRLAPMIRDTQAIRSRVVWAGARRGGNTLLHKNFFGGHVTLTGSNSPSSLASRPIRILLCDEVDRYEPSAGTEGDPLRLAVKRTTAFWNSRIGYFSTPGTTGKSRIAELYQDSDQRKYYIPCPHCGVKFVLLWDHLKWEEGEPATHEDGRPIRRAKDAWFECPDCGGRISDVERYRAVRAGEWRAHAPFHRRRGYWLWQGYSPWCSAIQTANEWLSALGRPEQERTVKNTVRGETYQESGEAPDWEVLRGRAEEYELGTIPDGVLFLTSGIDVQKDRIEMAVWGWGVGRERWLVDYIVLAGETAESKIWTQLDAAIGTTWTHPSGIDIGLSMTAIDAQHETTRVYDFARKHGPSRVIAVHGRDRGSALVWQSARLDYRQDGKVIIKGFRPYNLNVSMCKTELYSLLRAGASAVGRVHVPRALPDEWFRQLCAEQLQTKYHKGYAKGEWVKLRERNEALDTANYARAAAAHMRMDTYQERHWKAWQDLYVDTGEAKPEPKPKVESPPPPPQQPQPQAQRMRPSWLGDRKGWIRR